MTLKTALKNVRGWFPQNPKLPASYKPLSQVPYMVGWLTLGAIGGVFAAGMLVLLGDVTGINSGYAAVLWYIEAAFFAWCVGGFIALYGYFKHRRAVEGKEA